MRLDVTAGIEKYLVHKLGAWIPAASIVPVSPSSGSANPSGGAACNISILHNSNT